METSLSDRHADACVEQIKKYEEMISTRNIRESRDNCSLCKETEIANDGWKKCRQCVLGPDINSCMLTRKGGTGKYFFFVDERIHSVGITKVKKRLKYLLEIFNKRFEGRWVFGTSVDLSDVKI